MKRAYLAVVGMVFSAGAFGGTYSGGVGTALDPYRIGTAADWQELMGASGDWGKHFILLNDIDLSGIVLAPVGNYTTPFCGVFDGKGNVIRNAVVNLPSNDAVALFEYLRYPGTICDLGVEDLAITGRSRVGGLVAVSSGGEVTDCHISGSVTGSQADIGGIVAFNAFGTIRSSYSTATVQTRVVSGCGSVGGLVGYNWGTVQSCYATGPVTGHGTIGGLVGYNAGGGTVVGCHASGLVTSVYDAGGLVGQNSGIVAASYATGNQASQWHVGGCVGWNNQGKVFHCYSTGQPAGTGNVGGFCGYINTGGNYEDVGNFWDKETSLLSGSAMGTGKTTAEMKTRSTFAAVNWDFAETWGISEGVSYPWLRPVSSGQSTLLGDLNGDGRVDMEDFALFAAQWLMGKPIVTEDDLPPTPDPAAWVELPMLIMSPLSMRWYHVMEAVPAADPSGVEYRFVCTDGPYSSPWMSQQHPVPDGSGAVLEPWQWMVEVSGVSDKRSYYVIYRDMSPSQNQGQPSPTYETPLPMDILPPTPDPAVWAELPGYFLSSFDGRWYHTMAAEEAADPSGVEYRFVCTDGPYSSPWMSQHHPAPDGSGAMLEPWQWMVEVSGASDKRSYYVIYRDMSPSQNQGQPSPTYKTP